MKRFLFFMALTALFMLAGCNSKPREVKILIVETSDVHGSFFPYDFIKKNPRTGSLARVSSYLREQRDSLGEEHVVYVDNGDILQGQPCAYYFNYIDTTSQHPAAAMLSHLGCAAGSVGNHDIETGHAVYDRWLKDCNFPMVCANMVDEKSGEPYVQPYTVVERDGVKIAFLGMITPAIPNWLPGEVWKGLRFENIEKSAARWIKIIEEKESPNLIIGLFHSGLEGGIVTPDYSEDAVLSTARNVPGFDAILYGHDHVKKTQAVVNVKGDTVLLVNPGANAMSVATLQFNLVMKGNTLLSKRASMNTVSLLAYRPDSLFTQKFDGAMKQVEAYVAAPVARLNSDLVSRNAYFGPSLFVDLIHRAQLDLTGADVSFACPLTYNTAIKAGDLSVGDMFKLYGYENRLCTMRLTGKQIKDYLEMSYGLWSNTMKSPSDHMMLIGDSLTAGRASFVNPTYNFDSAAGLLYEVDLTKPVGEKVTIRSMADGRPFSLTGEYKVALNSYRAMGGGELLTKGAGLDERQMKERLLSMTGRDERSLLTSYLKDKKEITPTLLDQWRFVPQNYVRRAAPADRMLLFGTTE